MLRMEIWGRGNYNRVYFLRGGDLLVRFGSEEELGSIERCVAFRLLQLVESRSGCLKLVLKQVSQRDYASAACLDEGLCILEAPPPTPEQANTHRRVRSRAEDKLRLDENRPCCSRCQAHKLAPVEFA
jgi:hypothetical protein